MKIVLIISLCLFLHAALSVADDDDNSSDDSSSSSSSNDGSSSTSSSEAITNHFTSVDVSRQEGESEEEYYRRLVVRYESESDEEYTVRIVFLKLLLPSLSIWKDNKYEQYVTTTSRTASMSQTSHSSQTSQTSTSSHTSGTKVVGRRSVVRQVSEKQTFEKYETETEEEYYKRILTKHSHETGEQYLKRIAIIKKQRPDLEIWKEEKFIEFMKTHIVTSSSKIVTRRKVVNVNEKYLEEIEQRSGESEEVYYKRIFKRHADESVKQYKERINEIQKRLPDLEVWKNEKYKQYVSQYTTKNTKTSTSKTTKKVTTKKEKTEKKTKVTVNTKYLEEIEQRSDEKREEYYKRIFEKHSDEDDRQYYKRVQEIRRRMPKLDVWKDNRYKQYTKQQKVATRRKKSTVTVKEQYLQQIERQSSESEETYYTRIFKRHDDESKEEYRKRVEVLKQKLPHLDVWKNNRYEKYTNVYSSRVVITHLTDIQKKEEETEEVYYKRIFKKHDDECLKQYKKRISELRKELPDLKVWKNNEYKKYIKEYTQTTTKSVTKTTQEHSSSQHTSSDHDSSVKVVGRRSVGSEKVDETKLAEDKKKLQKLNKGRESTVKVNNKDKNKKNKDDDKSSSESNDSSDSDSDSDDSSSTSSSEAITNHFTSVDVSRHEGESEEEYYKRIVVRYEEETNEEYETRIAFLKVLLPKLSIWTENKYKQYVSTVKKTTTQRTERTEVHHVTEKQEIPKHEIEKYETETEEEYYKRILTKRSHETGEQYLKRIATIRKEKPDLEIWKEQKFTEFMKSHVVTSSSKIVTRRKTVNVHQKYLHDVQKRSEETEEVYYKRIFKRHAEESIKEYKQRVKELQKRLPDLKVWKNDEYKKYVSQQTVKTTTEKTTKRVTKQETKTKVTVNTKYLSEIEQRSSESKEEYYKRIFFKHEDEDEKQYRKRVQEIKNRKPDLDVWKGNQYRKYTKQYTVVSRKKRSTVNVNEKYLTEIERKESETEETYYKRIFRRHSDETQEQYRKRVEVLKTKLPHLTVWKDNKYEEYTSVYSSRVVTKYMTEIQKKEEESEETYYQRIFRKYEDENKVQYRKRIDELKKELPDLKVWQNNEYEKYTSSYISFSKTSKSSKTVTSEQTTSSQTTSSQTSGQDSSTKVVGRRSVGSEKVDETKLAEDKKKLEKFRKAQESTVKVNNKDKNKKNKDDDKSSSESNDSSDSDSDSDDSSSTSSSEALTNHFTSVDVSRHEGESEEEYYKRIVVRYEQETNEEYETRIAFLKVLLPKLSIWTENRYKQYVSTVKKTTTQRTERTEVHHVTEERESQKHEIEKYETETEEEYYKRILTKRSHETGEQYLTRIAKIRKEKPDLEIWKEEKFTEFMKSHIVTSSSKIVTRRKIVNVHQKYLQDIQKRSEETEEVYYTRIFKKHAEESVKEYKQRVKELQKYLPDLKVWKNEEYKNYVSQQTVKTTTERTTKSVTKKETKDKVTVNTKYLSEIEQRSSESKEEYYKRIFFKHEDEDEKQYRKRVQEIKNRKPDLDVWKGNQYRKYTKQYTVVSRKKRSTVSVNEKYLTDIERKESETEETYYKRIFRRHSDETQEQYRKRVDVLKTKLPHLTVWKDNKYEEYTSVYKSRVVTKYMSEVQKREDESEETYYQRIFKKHEDESKVQYKKRIYELRKELPDLKVWQNNEYEKYVSQYVSTSKSSKSSKTVQTSQQSSKQVKVNQESSGKVVSRKSASGAKESEHASGRVEKRSVTMKNVKVKHLDEINKKDEETEEVYYRRILQKYSDESDDEYEERISVMKERLSHLQIWKNNEYRNYQSSESSTTITTTTTTTTTSSSSNSASQRSLRHMENVEKSESETEQDYYTRILRKHADESDEEYSERLQVMMKKLSHLSIWQNNDYVKYQETKQYNENKSSVTEVTYTEVVQEEHKEEHQEEHQEEYQEMSSKTSG